MIIFCIICFLKNAQFIKVKTCKKKKTLEGSDCSHKSLKTRKQNYSYTDVEFLQFSSSKLSSECLITCHLIY